VPQLACPERQSVEPMPAVVRTEAPTKRRQKKRQAKIASLKGFALGSGGREFAEGGLS
jgi:hypothetical protein